DDDLFRQLVGPVLGILHALIQDRGLLRHQFLSKRRPVKGERVLELLLAEARGVDPGEIVLDFHAAAGVIGVQLGGDFIQILAEHRIGPQEDNLGLLDDTRHKGLVHGVGTFRLDQLLGGGDRGRRGLLGGGGPDQARDRESKQQGNPRPDGGISKHGEPPLQYRELASGEDAQDRSTTRTPFASATTAAWASPMNRPCSTTPAMPSRRSASARGSAIRSSAASRIQCPPSVTKAWPSEVRRSSAGPGQPTAAAAASTARRVAVSPNGTTSIGSGNLPSAQTHFDSSAMTIRRADAEATIFSRSSAPPPPLIRERSGAISSAPSTARSSSGVSSRLVSGTPSRSASLRVASEVGTATIS